VKKTDWVLHIYMQHSICFFHYVSYYIYAIRNLFFSLCLTYETHYVHFSLCFIYELIVFFLHYVFICESFCCYSLTMFSRVKSLCFIVVNTAVHAHLVFTCQLITGFHAWTQLVLLLLLLHYVSTCEITWFHMWKGSLFFCSLSFHAWINY
jgi:hypothetical protein